MGLFDKIRESFQAGKKVELFNAEIPKITISDDDKQVAGTVIGGAIGAALGTITLNPAGVIAGASAGAAIGGSIGAAEAQKGNQKKANIKALRDSEAARIGSVNKQLGAQQQAESLAVAGLRGKAAGTGGNNPANAPLGAIGANLSTSGTF